MDFFEHHKNKILTVVSCIIFMIISIVGYILYKKGLGIGVDWSLAIIGFAIASAVFLMALASESKTIVFFRNIFIYILASISIYVSMGLKFDIEQMNQKNDSTTVIKNQ
jgi:hypothetical protein